MPHLGNELILSCSSITGTSVRTPGDEKVGEIKDVMLNTTTGDVAYVVLSVDTGFLNLQSKYFAIPWQVLSFDTAHKEVIIFDIDKERLERSPGFDKDNWPAGPQLEFIDEVHNYYGLRDYGSLSDDTRTYPDMS